MKNIIKQVILIAVMLSTSMSLPAGSNLKENFSKTCPSLLLEDAPQGLFEQAFARFLDNVGETNLDPNKLLDQIQSKQLARANWSKLYTWYYKFYRQLLELKQQLASLTPIHGTIATHSDLSRNTKIVGEYLLTYTYFCIAKHLVITWETDLPSYGTEPLAQDFWKHQNTESESNLIQIVTELSNQCDSWSIAPRILKPALLSETYFDGFDDRISPRTLQLFINFMKKLTTKVGKKRPGQAIPYPSPKSLPQNGVTVY
jgi:hypothetical protein